MGRAIPSRTKGMHLGDGALVGRDGKVLRKGRQCEQAGSQRRQRGPGEPARPGVPEEAREAIFRRFQSIRPETEAFGQHSGLGLAIARTIVEAHQGSIIVESREDRLAGARFVVRLPIAGAPSAAD